MNSSTFWDITPCSPLKFNRHSGGTCRLRLQGRRISRERNQRETDSKFLLGLFFDTEDGGDMLVRKLRVTFRRLHGVISQKTELLG
jgi:hypothetical protein